MHGRKKKKEKKKKKKQKHDETKKKNRQKKTRVKKYLNFIIIGNKFFCSLFLSHHIEIIIKLLSQRVIKYSFHTSNTLLFSRNASSRREVSLRFCLHVKKQREEKRHRRGSPSFSSFSSSREDYTTKTEILEATL